MADVLERAAKPTKPTGLRTPGQMSVVAGPGVRVDSGKYRVGSQKQESLKIVGGNKGK